MSQYKGVQQCNVSLFLLVLTAEDTDRNVDVLNQHNPRIPDNLKGKVHVW